jgi:hypothetical protein
MTTPHDQTQTTESGAPECDRLLDYVYGELEGVARGRFEAHLQTCATCAAEARSFGAVRSAVSAALPMVEAPMAALPMGALHAQLMHAAASRRPTPEGKLLPFARRVRAVVQRPSVAAAASFAVIATAVGLNWTVLTREKGAPTAESAAPGVAAPVAPAAAPAQTPLNHAAAPASPAAQAEPPPPPAAAEPPSAGAPLAAEGAAQPDERSRPVRLKMAGDALSAKERQGSAKPDRAGEEALRGTASEEARDGLDRDRPATRRAEAPPAEPVGEVLEVRKREEASPAATATSEKKRAPVAGAAAKDDLASAGRQEARNTFVGQAAPDAESARLADTGGLGAAGGFGVSKGGGGSSGGRGGLGFDSQRVSGSSAARSKQALSQKQGSSLSQGARSAPSAVPEGDLEADAGKAAAPKSSSLGSVDQAPPSPAKAAKPVAAPSASSVGEPRSKTAALRAKALEELRKGRCDQGDKIFRMLAQEDATFVQTASERAELEACRARVGLARDEERQAPRAEQPQSQRPADKGREAPRMPTETATSSPSPAAAAPQGPAAAPLPAKKAKQQAEPPGSGLAY